MTSSSRTLPPGWMTHTAPASIRTSSPSRNGKKASEAATHPANGDWYYYVTVNLRTGETKFAESPEEFAQYKAEYLEYCETSDAC